MKLRTKGNEFILNIELFNNQNNDTLNNLKSMLKKNEKIVIVFNIEVFTEKVINTLNDLKDRLKENEKIIITSSKNLLGVEW